MSVRKPRSTRAGRVTMQDVARRVGVSAITVSRALRTPDKVAEAPVSYTHLTLPTTPYV